MALIDCLIKPAGFAVEVHYLDRSVGDEVNTHRFEKNESEGVTPPDAPVVRILYRPYVSPSSAYMIYACSLRFLLGVIMISFTRKKRCHPHYHLQHLLLTIMSHTSILCRKCPSNPQAPSTAHFMVMYYRHQKTAISICLMFLARCTRTTSDSPCTRSLSSNHHPFNHSHSRQPRSATPLSTQVISRAKTSSPKFISRLEHHLNGGAINDFVSCCAVQARLWVCLTVFLEGVNRALWANCIIVVATLLFCCVEWFGIGVHMQFFYFGLQAGKFSVRTELFRRGCVCLMHA